LFKIDFTNTRNNKLFFYEKRNSDNKLIEYAYIPKNEDFIYFKPEEDSFEHEYPKKYLKEFLLIIYKRIGKEKYNINVDRKSKASRPNFKLKILSKNLAVITYLTIQLGFLNALKKMGVKYQLSKSKIPNSDIKDAHQIIIAAKNEKGTAPDYNYLYIFPETPYQEYLINGISDFKNKVNWYEDQLNKPELLLNWTNEKLGNGFFYKLRELRDKIIDNTTEKILKSYHYDIDPIELFGKTMPEMILNNKIDDHNDLSTKRIRMSESIAHLAYKQLQIGIINFKKEKKTKNPKVRLIKDYIIKELIGSGMLQWATPINPLDELNATMKIIKTGVGNPLKNQITVDKRDLNPSYFGTVSPVHTNEYGGIGLNQVLTNNSTIKDRFGSILIKKFTNESNPFENLSFQESLTPFYERDDTTRRVMGNQQTGQFVQIDDPDVPLIQTGFEGYIPYLVSDRFAIKAKKDGQTIVKHDHIHMKYNDGSEEIFSTKPTKARTKRGLYVPLEYNVLVKNNQKVKAEEILATTNSLKYGKIAIGKNLVVAEMSYRGMNYEDGWVVSEDLNEKFQSKLYDKVVMVVPENTTITKLNINKEDTKPGDILLEYQTSSQKYLDYDEKEDENEDDLTVGKEILGNIVRYRSIGGKIADVVIYLNSKKVDKEILNRYNLQVSEINSKLKICEKMKNNGEKLNCRDNVEFLNSLEIGGHKANKFEPEGAIIEVYIEKENPIRYGSKFTLANSGGKGTVQYVIPKDKKPVTTETHLELDFIATPLSIISRKNPSILLQLYTGKVIYFINKKIEELANEGSSGIPKIEKLLKETYGILDKSEDHFIIESINAFFKNKSDFILKYIKKHDPLQNPAFPLIVPPYSNPIQINDIEKVAKIIKIPLQEKVEIKEEGKTTEYEVTVGIMPIYYLEHMPKAMSGIRSSLNAKRQLTLGQGKSGTKEGNGAIKIGVYDMFSLISREPEEVFRELWVAKSDNEVARKELTKKILRSDEGEEINIDDIELQDENSVTKKLIKAYFYGAALEPQM